MASFGMMNQAYFVGKNILIDWINNFLEIDIAKVEEMANGAIYCNLWDALHPGTIPMSRVDFTVKHEYDFVKNFKLLQNGFQKIKIQKVIPVQRLIKARYQDNLEFFQWFYKYARDTYNGDPDEPTYDAAGRRAKSKGGRDYRGGGSKSKPNNKRSSKYTSNRNKNSRNSNKENSRYSNTNRPTSASSRYGNTNSRQYTSQRNSNNNNNTNNNNQELEELRKENKRLTESNNATDLKLNQLTSEHNELNAVAKDIEKERDFYFNKVLAVEDLLKKNPDQSLPLIQQIFNLLYQTEEEAQLAANNNNNDQQNNNNDQQNNNNSNNNNINNNNNNISGNNSNNGMSMDPNSMSMNLN